MHILASSVSHPGVPEKDKRVRFVQVAILEFSETMELKVLEEYMRPVWNWNCWLCPDTLVPLVPLNPKMSTFHRNPRGLGEPPWYTHDADGQTPGLDILVS